MFAKSAFVVRSLFAAAVLGSLVACTFDPSTGEDKNDTTSAELNAKKKGHADGGSANDGGIVTSSDGGFEENDASCWKCDVDAGPYDGDGGVWTDNDGGAYEGDGGWWGDDDDDSSDAGIYDDRDAGF